MVCCVTLHKGFFVVNLSVEGINFSVGVFDKQALAYHYSHGGDDVDPLVLADALEEFARELRAAVRELKG